MKGYRSIGVEAGRALTYLGVKDKHILQGFSSLKGELNSGSFHLGEGQVEGHPFSSCVDLDYSLASVEFKSKLIEVGFCPFFREERNNNRIHCVYVGDYDHRGEISILAGPREQIIDFTKGLNGLTNHAPIEGIYAPTEEEKEFIKDRYQKWVPDTNSFVLSPEGENIPCYLFFEKSYNKLRCEVPTFYSFWGINNVNIDGKYHFYDRGKEIRPANSHISLEAGNFLRGDILGVANEVGFGIIFDWDTNKQNCIVQLNYTKTSEHLAKEKLTIKQQAINILNNVLNGGGK
jgi:hypothetical protein